MSKIKDYIQKKGKGWAFNLAAAVFLGVILLVMGSGILQKKPDGGTANVGEPSYSQNAGADTTATAAMASYEKELEKRLEELLSLVDGAGEVKVMLTLASGKEIEVAEDTVTNASVSEETDSSGGTRKTQTRSSDEKNIIITDKNGGSSPLVIKERTPAVEGIVIVARGGDSAFVREALTRAAQALLGLEAHKVQVFKMK